MFLRRFCLSFSQFYLTFLLLSWFSQSTSQSVNHSLLNNDHFERLFSYRITPFRRAALSSENSCMNILFMFLLSKVKHGGTNVKAWITEYSWYPWTLLSVYMYICRSFWDHLAYLDLFEHSYRLIIDKKALAIFHAALMFILRFLSPDLPWSNFHCVTNLYAKTIIYMCVRSFLLLAFPHPFMYQELDHIRSIVSISKYATSERRWEGRIWFK